MRYFHGGPPGLGEGDEILPPCESGVQTRHDLRRNLDPITWQAVGQDAIENRDRQWVFVGSRLEATRFAGLWSISPFNGDRFGSVYEVAPAEGSAVRPDPFSPRDEGWMCRSATVVRVDARQVDWKMLQMMGVEPPGQQNLCWRDVDRYFSLLLRADAEGRQVTPEEHAAAVRAQDEGAIWRLAYQALGL